MAWWMDRALAAICDLHHHMILQILTDAFDRHACLDTVFRQLVGIADAESISICGELITPPARMTSHNSRARFRFATLAKFHADRTTALKQHPRHQSLDLGIVRFSRSNAGRKYAAAALQRRPSRIVFWLRPMPSFSGPLRSSFHARPVARDAAT